MTPYDKAALVGLMRGLLRPLEPIPTDRSPELTRMRHVRAVLFDVYGTLLVSSSGDVGSAGKLQVCANVPHVVPERLRPLLADPVVSAAVVSGILARHETMRKRGIEHPEIDILEIWREVLGAFGHLEDDAAIIAVTYECCINPVWPMPGMLDALSSLRKRGMVLGIVSNAQFYTPLVFEALTGQSLADLGFDVGACAWSYMLGVAKPSPNVLASALAELQRAAIEPQDVMVIGNDLAKDIAPAKALGCHAVLFAGDQRSLRSGGSTVAPDAVITDLRQLSSCLA